MQTKLAFITVLTLASAAVAQPDFDEAQIRIRHVQGNVYLVAGPGGNTTAQLGPEGVLLVDTQFESVAQRIREDIADISPGPLRYIINTHMHPDHVGGNAVLLTMTPETPLEPLKIHAHNNVFFRLAQLDEDDPMNIDPRGWPYATYDTPSKDFFFNGEGILLFHEPNAHTDGDTIVHFRGSDVVSTGDIFVPGSYPFIDIERGGSIAGLVDALNHILALTIPAFTQEGGTYVIPGHGRICDEADVVEYRDMVVIIRDRIQNYINQGMSLREVQRQRPTLDYDSEYVSEDSFVMAEEFVAAIYRSLTDNS
jgi:cyclase